MSHIEKKVEYDVSIFEAKKALQLMIKGNCNVLEELYAPSLYRTPEYAEIRKIIEGAYGKDGLYNSYRGMAYQNYKKFIMEGRNTVKKYLYVIRALMAGSYALKNGTLQPNMEILVKHYREPLAKNLLEIKKAGLENDPLEEIDSGELDLLIEKWFNRIDEEFLGSKLPDKMSDEDIESIEKWLIRKREIL